MEREFLQVIDMALFCNLPHKKEDGKETYNEVADNIEKTFDELEDHMYKEVNFDEYGVIALKYKDDETYVIIWLNGNNVSMGYFKTDDPYVFKYIVNKKYKDNQKVVTINNERSDWVDYKPKTHSLISDSENGGDALIGLFVDELMAKLGDKYGDEEWFEKLKEKYLEYKFINA